MSSTLNRREFLRSGAATAALGLAAAVSTKPASAGAGGEPQVRRFKRLGRTGLEVSDISFGSSRMSDPDVVRHALARGINYFDSAESYKGGDSERAIGEALVGSRQKVFLTSKTKCGSDSTRGELMEALEGSLRRLRTDWVDIYFNHAVNDVDRLKNDEWYEFAAKAKTDGKIRFTGISGHAGRLVECLDHAIDNDLVDVILAAYNFGQDPAFYQRFLSRIDWVAVQSDLPRVLSKAHAKQIGVVAMKTLRGAKLNDMRPFERGVGGSGDGKQGPSFAQAAFRWTLSNPSVDALVVSMNSKEQIDEYLGASGESIPDATSLELLEEYLLTSEGYCEHGCEACHSSCPAGVAISEVLRTRMYATDYLDREYAREDYAKLAALGVDASPCAACIGQPCTGACPSGLPVGRLTRSTPALVS